MGLNLFKDLFKKSYRKRYFTYFVPSPPQRKSSYQEKEVDKITYHLQNLGFEIEERIIKVLNTERSSGFWIFYTLVPQNEEVSLLDLNFNYASLVDSEIENIEIEDNDYSV